MNNRPRYASTPKLSISQITSSQKGTPIASNVGLANINWQATTTAVENAPLVPDFVKNTFDGGTTPAGVSATYVATFSGTTNIKNKGSYRIVASDSTTMTVVNKQRTDATYDETGSPGTVTIYNPTFVTLLDSSINQLYVEAISICTNSPYDVSVLFKLEQTSPALSVFMAELTVPALTGMNGQPPINLLSVAAIPAQKIAGGITFPPGFKITSNAVVESPYSVDFIVIYGDYANIA